MALENDTGQDRTEAFKSRFRSKILVLDNGCWQWNASLRLTKRKAPRSRKYGQVWDPLRGRPVPAHCMAWEIYRGSVPDGEHVHQTCGNTLCVNPDHLTTSTQVRMRHGANHPHAKLTRELVDQARSTFDRGMSWRSPTRVTLQDLANEYQVSKELIRRTVSGHNTGGFKLTPEQIYDIRRRYQRPVKIPTDEINEQLGEHHVTKSTIYAALAGRTWVENDAQDPDEDDFR